MKARHTFPSAAMTDQPPVGSCRHRRRQLPANAAVPADISAEEVSVLERWLGENPSLKPLVGR